MLRPRYEDHSLTFESRNCALVIHPVLFINGRHLRAKQIIDVQLSGLFVCGEIHARHEPVRDLHLKRVRHHAWPGWSVDILLYGKDKVDNAFLAIVRLPVVPGMLTNFLTVSLSELRLLGPMQSNRQMTGVKAGLN